MGSARLSAPTPEPTETPTPAPVIAPAPAPTPGREGTRKDILASVKDSFREAEPGDRVLFGHYEQDLAKQDNGREDISWLVLAKENDRIMLLSEYALDMRRFNEDDRKADWEHSTVRAWLNGSFLRSAFSKRERDLILETVLPNGTNPHFPDLEATDDTADRVFLLSVEELERYLPEKEQRVAFAAGLVKKSGVVYRDGSCWWWLRSPGTHVGNISYVNTGGTIVHKHVSTYNYAIRPAVWCRLSDG